QVLAAGLNSHRSLRLPRLPVESSPKPPKIQKFPASSTQLPASLRAPGTLLADATPKVPYTPTTFPVSFPLIQIHVWSEGLNFHRSLSSPCAGKTPPNSQKSPFLSLQLVELSLAPGTLLADAKP